MAITKIKPIKTTLDKSLDYICNPSKTKHNLQTVDELEKCYDFDGGFYPLRRIV